MTREEKIKELDSIPAKRGALDAREAELKDQIEITEIDILGLTKGKPEVGQEVWFCGKGYRITGLGKDKDGNTSVGWESL